jgi:translocation and assembly module TamB
MRRWLRILRWTGIGAAVVAGAAALALLSAYAYLQTDGGRARVVAALNEHLGAPGGTRVHIGRVAGELPGGIEIHDLSVADGAGTWLHLEFASARWDPWALLAGTLDVEKLSAHGLRVLRAPEQAGAERDGEFEWPGLSLKVAVARFSLRDAVLERPLLGEAIAFRASGETAIDGPDQVRTTVEIVRSDGVSGQGRVEVLARPRSKFLRFALAVNESGGGLLARAMNLEGLPALTIQAEGEGPVDAVAGTARARAGDLAHIETRFTIDATDRRSLHAEGRANVARLIEAPLGELLSDEVAFELEGALTGMGIRLQPSTVSNDFAHAEISGELRDFETEVDVVLAVHDLERLAEMAGVELRGRAEIRSRIRSEDLRKGLTAATTATLSEPLPVTDPLHVLTGTRVDLEGNIELQTGERIAVRDLKATTPSIAIDGNGSLDLETREIEAALELRVARLAAFSDAARTPLTGALAATGEVGGTAGEPTVRVQLSSSDLSVDGHPVGAANGTVSVDRFAGGVGGHVSLVVDHGTVGKVSAASRFAHAPDDKLHLDDLNLSARDGRVAGALTVDLSAGTVAGRLQGEAIPLAPWSGVAGNGLSGTARLTLTMVDRAGRQQLDAAIGATDLNIALSSHESVSVGVLEGSVRFDDLLAEPEGDLGLQLTRVTVPDGTITSAALELDLPELRRGAGRLHASGDLNGPFALDAAGGYTVEEAGYVVTITELTGSLREQAIALAKPARLAHLDGTTTLSESTLTVAGGRLTAAGSVGADAIEGRVAIEDIALAELHAAPPVPELTGTLAGHVRVSGTREAPTGDLLLESTNVRSAHTSLTVAPPSSGRLRGDWRDGRLTLNASLAEVAKEPIEATASLPLVLEPESLALAVPADGAIDGTLRWAGELGPVWDLLSPYEDRFSGPGDLALSLSGTVGLPRVSGHLLVPDGRYENVLSGTTLTGVNLRLVGSGDKLILEQLTASDGKKGTLTGGGTILLRPEELYPTNLGLEFSELQMVARDDLILVADGDLALEGTATNVLLSGRIVTGSSELSLAGTLPPDVVELEVDEVNATDPARVKKGPEDAAEDPSVVILDIDLVVPGRAFVRGLGLDSEWSGDLTISGDAAAPHVSGTLSPVRGHFALLGKRFDLDKGAIRFTGSDEIDPLLDLSAERRTTSLTAIVRVTGSASNPTIKLTSRPPLPESEIASQVLFGTDSQNLSAAQSLQLASAIATYSGKGGAVGILDATRRTLGVDAINFAESKEDPDKTRVSVGKYVTEGVYIELERGTEEDSRTATTVEVEVLPDVRLEGGTTEQGGNKVGVKWKWDY